MTSKELQLPENWDFAWVLNRPLNEGLLHCFYYEMGRHIPKFIASVEQKKKQNPTATILAVSIEDNYADKNAPITLGMEVLQSLLGSTPTRNPRFDTEIAVPRDYPAISYKAFQKRTNSNEKPSSEVEQWAEMLAPMYCENAWLYLNKIMNDVAEFKAIGHNSEVKSDSVKLRDDMVLLQLPSNASKTALMNAFERFLDSHMTGRSQKKSGKDTEKTYRSLLKKLGAWRLLRSGWTAIEAESESQRGAELHKPLYGNSPEWTEAKQTIDRVFRTRFNTPDPI